MPSSRSPHPPPSVYEDWNAGGYGYSVNGRSPQPPALAVQQYSNPPHPLHSQPIGSNSSSSSTGQASQLARKSCECPMCYHSIRNPCAQCGCPSNTVPKSARLNPTQRPAFTDQQTALSFFSPSSDYYSLSPDSPPLSGATAASNSSPEPDAPPPAGGQTVATSPVSGSAASTVPIYAQVHKERSADASSPPPVQEESCNPQSGRSSLSPVSDGQSGNNSPMTGKPVKKGPPTARKPSLPMRHHTDEDKKQRSGGGDCGGTADSGSGSRRHSWAGERKTAGASGGRLGSRPTTLQEFKKLLAQQTPGPNPHRLSAQEMLKTAAGGGQEQPAASSQQKPGSSGSGGSLRKKTSPWRDHRFSVIQEEAEHEESRRSRENLLD